MRVTLRISIDASDGSQALKSGATLTENNGIIDKFNPEASSFTGL